MLSSRKNTLYVGVKLEKISNFTRRVKRFKVSTYPDTQNALRRVKRRRLNSTLIADGGAIQLKLESI